MADVVVAQRMWQRRDSAVNWTSVNPVLAAGEIGVELGASIKFKIGNGTAAWNTLPYAGGGIPEAPIDGQQYARKDATWEVVEGGGTPAGWDIVTGWTPGSTSPGWADYTLRSYITSAVVGEGSKIRLTIKAPASGALHISKMFAGVAAGSGDPYDFAATPASVLFSGASSVVIAAGATVVSDELTLALDGISNLVLSTYFPSTPAAEIHTSSTTGWGYVYKTGDDASTVDASGYSGGSGSTGVLVHKLEVWREGTGGGGTVWYTGSGAPSGALGVDGDFYLRSSNGAYYQKISGTWTLQGNLTGPTGPAGPAGPTGATGPAGAAGAPGPTAAGLTFGGGDGVNPIVLGTKQPLVIPFNHTITGWALVTDNPIGVLTVELWRDALANYPPTAADKITASAPPLVSSSDHGSSTTLTGWATSGLSGDVYVPNVVAASGVARWTLTLYITKVP